MLAIGFRKPIGVNLQRVADTRRAQSFQIELLGHICEEMILYHKNKMFVEMLEGFDLVMQLHKDRLCGHLPVHPE